MKLKKKKRVKKLILT